MATMEINELYRKRGKALADARSIVDQAETEARELTTEEDKRYEALVAESQRLMKQIKRAEELAEQTRALEDKQPKGKDNKLFLLDGEQGSQRSTSNILESQEYRESFIQYLRHDRMGLDAAEARALSIGTNTAGGYTVPIEFEKQLIKALENQNIMRSLATVITTSGDHQIPVVTSHGSASWVAEAGAITDTDEVFGQVILSAYKAATLMKVSEELLHDSAFNLESYVATEYGRRIGMLEEAGFVAGTGTTQPTGVVSQATAGPVLAAGNTTSIGTTADPIYDLYYALKRAYRGTASWLLHDQSIKIVAKLKDTTNQYIWQPGLQSGQPDRILGRPVYASDFMPIMAANAKSILFGDFSYYWICERQGKSIQRLNELYAANGQIGFKGFERVDGKLTLTDAVKYLQNSAT